MFLDRIQKLIMGKAVGNVAIQRAHRECAGLFFLGTYGEDQRNLIELGFTNLFIQAFGPIVNLRPQVGFFELGFNRLGMRYQIIIDW